MRRYLCSIMQLSQAFSRRYLGNHFSAIRARHSRGLHISRSPMPFARPTSVHPIAISYQRILLQAFQPILSFTDSPIPFRYNPSPSLLPSSLVLIVLRVWNRRGEEFAVSVIALDASHRPLSAKN